jgi:hypothetical protein
MIDILLLLFFTGDVLEISAGTGRSLPYYSLNAIKSLTLTDLSMPMLERAEDKFYDTLKLGEKHPSTRISFCLSDAHCMTAEPKEVSKKGSAAALVHTLPAMRQMLARRSQLPPQPAVDPPRAPSSSSSAASKPEPAAAPLPAPAPPE